MNRRRSGAPIIVIMFIISISALCVSLIAMYHFNVEIEASRSSPESVETAFQLHSSQQFINSAIYAEPYHSYADHDHSDALYSFEAPEGFTIISHSTEWNQEMLERLYHELLLNEHGKEINMLNEIIIFPHENEDINVLGSYSLSTEIVSFLMPFPALPPDFTINFQKNIGNIHLYDGDTNITIESMAGSLSHEYGHLFTFYHMFYAETNEDGLLIDSRYAQLRGAEQFDLITSATPGSTYMQERHRYLIEIAAEDYVQLMGSPTTRSVVDFVDVQQVLDGAEHPANTRGARNAFPQENMMLPLANDVPGLKEYFFSFVDAEPRAPIEEKQEITLQITRNSEQHYWDTELRTFINYTITWNAPYENAIYTLISYDPNNYTGWGTPIKTVHPGHAPSAIIGEYVVARGNRIYLVEDENAHGVKVFVVVAMLPDGTYHVSEKLEYEF